MTEAVSNVVALIKSWTTEENFSKIFRKAEAVDELNMEKITLPRRAQVQLPQRYRGDAKGYIPADAEIYYRQLYFEFLGFLQNTLETRSESSNTDLNSFCAMEEMLISGNINENIVAKYPELNSVLLPILLEMFRHTTAMTSVREAKLAYQQMSTECRALFPQVQTLLKLLLVCPVTTCECERSFSALRRLKTWLRNSMSQQRLNHTSVGNVHRNLLDEVDVPALAEEFAEKTEIRRRIFGNF